VPIFQAVAVYVFGRRPSPGEARNILKTYRARKQAVIGGEADSAAP
jgi:hypothetical protein